MPYDLAPLISPGSVALVGANADPETIGGAPLRRLLDYGYQGDIHLVSRRETQISDIKCVGTVDALPTGIDVALLAVPSAAVPQVLSDLTRRDIKSAIVYASGFAETGEGGRAAQAHVVDIARAHAIPVSGPNCLGLVNFVDGVPLTFSALQPRRRPPAPGLSIISQSGAMAMALTYAAHAQGVDVAYTVSTGNEAVLAQEDYLDHLSASPMTRVIALLIEQVRHPERFLECARRAREAGKPIIALKAGRSAAARQAALSHTGALAGDYETIETILGSEGVVLVDSMDELIDLASLLVGTETIEKAGTAVMSESGSVKTLALDSAARNGATLADLTPTTVERLDQLIPDFAEATNPIDITGQALLEPSLYGEVARALLDDPNVNLLIASTMPGTEVQTRDQVDALLPVLAAADKPVIYTFAGGGHPVPADLDQAIRAGRVPVFPSFDRALRAVAHAERRLRLAELAEQRGQTALPTSTEAAPAGAEAVIIRDENASKAALRDAGVRVPAAEFAPDAKAALDRASEIGFPMVAKGVSALVHKTEAGGVVVGIRDRAELERALATIADGIADAGHTLDGYLLEEMVPAGVDLIVGARRDDEWGVVLLVGLGGVLAEATRDTTLLPGVATPQDIVGAFTSLRGAAVLSGFRGRPPVDMEAVVHAVSALGTLMRDNPHYVDVDVNPLRALPVGAGAVALDATIIERVRPHHGHDGSEQSA
ncbi:acetate--CoA ligase family protein [Streptomyces sp. NPDC029041]|uniref:acetate--CoA ligase family protein n=1 Tax=Streptomyces sp. NPDC029041 TaxID=3155727 RepID=UPI0033C58213